MYGKVLVYKMWGVQNIFTRAFIMDTQVDIEKTLHRYLSQKCLQSFDMLKSYISALIGGPPFNCLNCYKHQFRMESLVDIKRGIPSSKPYPFIM